jgi:hypothetical protein
MPLSEGQVKFPSARRYLVLLIGAVSCAITCSPASASEIHPLVESKYWTKVGAFFATRKFGASAEGSALIPVPLVDFESSFGIGDRSDMLMMEFGWQFAEKWDFAIQHFRSSNSRQTNVKEAIEWEDVIYDLDAEIFVRTKVAITRLFWSRRFWDYGPHDLRLGGGLHWVDTSALISGEATLDDMSKEFRTDTLSAEFPVPNIGAWYRYSPSKNWVLNARLDWLSASTSDYSGRIWNAMAGADYRLSPNFGIGIAYQVFEIDGNIKEPNWRGGIESGFSGWFLSLDGFW